MAASFLIPDKKLNLCDNFARGASESTTETSEFLNRFEIVATELNRNILDDLLIIVRKLKIFKRK